MTPSHGITSSRSRISTVGLVVLYGYSTRTFPAPMSPEIPMKTFSIWELLKSHAEEATTGLVLCALQADAGRLVETSLEPSEEGDAGEEASRVL